MEIFEYLPLATIPLAVILSYILYCFVCCFALTNYASFFWHCYKHIEDNNHSYNMLSKRIHIQNPTAVRLGAGKLENYRLDFHTGSQFWRGAPATIVPTLGAHVYGSIWEIDMCNMSDLDNQEGVHQQIYVPIEVPVILVLNEETINCRAYHLTRQPASDLWSIEKDNVPLDRQPSLSYLKTLVKGALETGIPDEYVARLRTIRHNGTLVQIMEQQLDLLAVQI